MKIFTNSVQETRSVGARFAAIAKQGDVFALEGDLGTGKTEFVRGFTEFLDPVTKVRSPSFSIINIYQTSKINIYHFDFYRLNDHSELSQLGFDEYICGDGVCLIEWGTMFIDVLPVDTKIIRFSDMGTDVRLLETDFEI